MEKLNCKINIEFKVKKAKIKNFNKVEGIMDSWDYSFYLQEHTRYMDGRGYTEYYVLDNNTYIPAAALKGMFEEYNYILEMVTNLNEFLDEMSYPFFTEDLLQF